MQELLRQRDGVIATRVGYAGGENENPTYGNHPGHAEAVEIVFDPARISYRDILESSSRFTTPRLGVVRATTSAPTTVPRSSCERRAAPARRGHGRRRRRLSLWPGRVVPAISATGPFWEAEAEHQDYLQRYPDGYNCHFPRPNWKLPHRERAA